MKIAIIGGGQLARMLAMSGLRMGMEFSFLLDDKDRVDTRCIDGLGKKVELRPDSDWDAVFEALGRPDLITVEKEQIDTTTLELLSHFCPVYPSPAAFSICSYRDQQKQLLQQLDIPTSPFVVLSDNRDTTANIAALRFPLFAKSTHNAYDGRNQFVLSTHAELESFRQQQLPGSWILEEEVRYERELSIIAVRSVNGEMAFYPVTENNHRRGVLMFSISPAPDITPRVQQTLIDYAQSILSAMDYVGVLAIECFLTGEQVIVNEIAPRVHNSGHWTSAGSETCQFENHLRAITGLPLGATDSIGNTAMINLLGVEAPPLQLLNSRSSLHWYHKSHRPGRKVGHINLHNSSATALSTDIKRLITELETINNQSELTIQAT